MLSVLIWWCADTSELHVNTFFGNRQLSALDDRHSRLGLVARVLLNILDLLDNVVALEDLAEDNMLAIQPTTNSPGQLREYGR